MNKNNIATKVAWQFVGTLYRWGGDDPSGFDCSGLVIEILKSVGIINRKQDFTAAGLYNKFKHAEVQQPGAGCLIFWGKNKTKITHVEYCIDEAHTIGASGGGSTTLTHADAIKQNAYVKVRPIRQNYIAIVNPFLN